jgi:hypothetical protein
MIGVPGDRVENSAPPSAALLGLAAVQIGVLFAIAPVMNRLLTRGAWPRVISVANDNVMALYLWHMIPVVVVAIVAYPAGLLPQPPEGSGAWWLARLEWVVVLGLVTAFELVLLWWQRRLFAAPLPTVGIPLTVRWGEVVMLAGAAMASAALHFFAYAGFAPGGHFPWATAAAFAVGATLVALRPTKVGRPSTAPATQAG